MYTFNLSRVTNPEGGGSVKGGKGVSTAGAKLSIGDDIIDIRPVNTQAKKEASKEDFLDKNYENPEIEAIRRSLAIDKIPSTSSKAPVATFQVLERTNI